LDEYVCGEFFKPCALPIFLALKAIKACGRSASGCLVGRGVHRSDHSRNPGVEAVEFADGAPSLGGGRLDVAVDAI
jgi:hypothetical protein